MTNDERLFADCERRENKDLTQSRKRNSRKKAQKAQKVRRKIHNRDTKAAQVEDTDPKVLDAKKPSP
jgi:hypothetical protein